MPVVIIPSAANELLYRLTETLEIPFTLTDASGVVVASTAGRPSGQLDAYAMAVAKHGGILQISEEQLRAPSDIAAYSPSVEATGLLPPAPGVYAPVRIADEIGAVLFARGEPRDVLTEATTSAAAAGITLEFASSATSSIRASLGPDLALRAFLRGTVSEARRATLVLKVAGWDLLIPRAALVVVAISDNTPLPEPAIALLRNLLHALAPHSPFGQLSAAEWVALPALPRTEAQPRIEDIAREMEKALADHGISIVIGLGETHIDLPIVPALRRSYREAAFSAKWAKRLGADRGVHSIRSLGPIAFLAPGARAQSEHARGVLEPLTKSPEVLETLRIFLDSNLSIEAAAKQSGQHRHTVRSHLLRARELTGLDARQLSDALQLKLALLIAGPVQTV